MVRATSGQCKDVWVSEGARTLAVQFRAMRMCMGHHIGNVGTLRKIDPPSVFRLHEQLESSQGDAVQHAPLQQASIAGSAQIHVAMGYATFFIISFSGTDTGFSKRSEVGPQQSNQRLSNDDPALVCDGVDETCSSSNDRCTRGNVWQRNVGLVVSDGKNIAMVGSG